MGTDTVAGHTDEEEEEETDEVNKYEKINEKSQEVKEEIIEKPLYINLGKFNHVTYGHLTLYSSQC